MHFAVLRRLSFSLAVCIPLVYLGSAWAQDDAPAPDPIDEAPPAAADAPPAPEGPPAPDPAPRAKPAPPARPPRGPAPDAPMPVPPGSPGVPTFAPSAPPTPQAPPGGLAPTPRRGGGMMAGARAAAGRVPTQPTPHFDFVDDPEMRALDERERRLEAASRQLAETYRAHAPTTDDAAVDVRKQIRERLQQAVEEHFAVRQERRMLELRRIEERLAQLGESIKKRHEAKDVLIRQRLEQLLGEQDELGF